MSFSAWHDSPIPRCTYCGEMLRFDLPESHICPPRRTHEMDDATVAREARLARIGAGLAIAGIAMILLSIALR